MTSHNYGDLLELNDDSNYCRHFRMPLNFYDIDNYLSKPNLDKITRLVFLDIDGVLNFEGKNTSLESLQDFKWSCSFNSNEHDKYLGIFPDLVAILNKLHSKYPDIRYVLSSTWRSNYYGTIKYLKLQGFTGSIISRTKHRNEGIPYIRSEEIKDWLSYYNYTNDYIVIDDDDECLVFDNKLMHTDFSTGITTEIIDRAIDYFFNPPQS